MRRLTAALTTALLAASVLTGCGGDAEESAAPAETPTTEAPTETPTAESTAAAPGAGTTYCKLLGTDFAALFGEIQGPEDVAAAIGMIERIGNEAPPEVEKEWGRMQSALGQVEDALTEAARLQKQAASGKVGQKELREQTKKLTAQMQSLNTPANAKAGDAVAEHAGRHCGVQLG